MLVVKPPRLPLNLNGYNSEVMTHGNVRKPIIDAPTWIPMQSSGIHDGSSNLVKEVVLFLRIRKKRRTLKIFKLKVSNIL